MKRLIVLLVLIGQDVHGQEVNQPLGYFIDLKGNELDGYADFDYNGHVFHTSYYNSKYKYLKGSYKEQEYLLITILMVKFVKNTNSLME